MKIAVTGASGFIGQAVVHHLVKENVKITTFDKEKYNLLDSESLKDFVEDQEVIIHLAGVNRGTNYELVQVNTLGMLSLLEAVSKYAPAAKIVFASTFQVYLPQSLYGLSKRFAEDLLVLYALNRKVQSTILRLSNVYGPGAKPFYNSVITTFVHLIKNGEVLNVNGDGSSQRDFIYVDDVADAFAEAATHKQKDTVEIMDICSGESTSLNAVVNILKSLSEKPVEVKYNKDITDKPWPTKDKNFKKAKELLRWEPKTSLEEGLAQAMK